ncbi:phage protein GemA/Gp16 family protein [Variovorax sp. VNK109]|uniref:phage protein GemA/Gp16 family protein n=1 Tax=Variovorax sp. VNK109 TaxID=3400919 RepID=UPI003C02CD86
MADHARAADLKRIHAMQRQLGLLGEDAETVKHQVTGVYSSGDMNMAQRAKYIAHLQGQLARTGVSKPVQTTRRPSRPTPSPAAAPMVRRIRAQLISLGKLPDTYADGIAKQMLGDQAPKFFEWCTPRDLYKITQALGVEQDRKGVRK